MDTTVFVHLNYHIFFLCFTSKNGDVFFFFKFFTLNPLNTCLNLCLLATAVKKYRAQFTFTSFIIIGKHKDRLKEKIILDFIIFLLYFWFYFIPLNSPIHINNKYTLQRHPSLFLIFYLFIYSMHKCLFACVFMSLILFYFYSVVFRIFEHRESKAKNGKDEKNKKA